MASGTKIADMTVGLHFDGKSLSVSMKDIEKNATRAAENVGEKTGSGLGNKIASGASAALKTVAKAAVATGAAVTTAIGGVIATGGFNRAMDVEQAEFKLKGLGHSANDVEGIMDNALASVKGTAFGLGEAATVAASAVASGVRPGKELERTLKLTADAAAIAGSDMTEMGAIFNKVSANGKLSAEEMNQLADRGIPILQLLADTTGKTTDEVRDLVSSGKIGFAEFQNAIEKGMGGAALTMGQTFSGALENTKAALSRLGESFATPFMNSMTPVLGQVITLVDQITAGTVDNLDEQAKNIAKGVQQAFSGLVSNLTSILKKLVPAFSRVIGEMIPEIGKMIVELLPVVLDAAGTLVAEIASHLGDLVSILMQAVPSMVQSLANVLLQVVRALTPQIPTILNSVLYAIIDTVKLLTQPEFLQSMLQTWYDLFTSVLLALPDIIIAIADALPDIITNIVDFFTDPASIGLIIQAGVKLFGGLVQAVPRILNSLFSAFTTLFSRLWNRVKTIFQAFAGKFGEAVGNMFKKAVNGVLGFLEKFVNTPIRGINKLIDVINKVPGINLGHLSELSLPRLAKGGVANSGTTAIIGEAGREAVLPLERNTDNWSGLLASALAAEFEDRDEGTGRPIQITNNVTLNNGLDMTEFNDKMIRQLRRAA